MSDERRQTLLFDLLKGQRETDNPERIMVAAARTVGLFLGASRTGFFAVDRDDSIDYGVCHTDGTLPPLSGPAQPDVLQADYLAAKKAGETPVISDAPHDPRVAASALIGMGVHSGFSAAIHRGGHWVGGLYVHHAQPRDWTEAEIAFVRDVAELTWDAVERATSVRALRDSEQRFRFLSAIDEATRSVQNAGEIMRITTRMLGEYLNVSRCAYADMEADEDHFTIRADYCAPGVETTAGYYSLDLFGSKAVTDLKAGRTLILRDIGAELTPQDGRDMFHAIGINAIVTCPLVKEGHLKALMAVHDAQAHDWNETEVRLVEAVVERCWAHIERIRSEESLRELARAMSEARNAAEQASIAKTDFLANMSHEIRTPMNAVIGASQILARTQPLSERQEKLIAVLGDSANALMELINQVLDLSKIEARNLQLEQAPFDAQRLVGEIVRMMTLQARGKGLKLEVRNSCPCVNARLFIGDAARIKQILVNLCGNAMKFTEDGGITITITCEHTADVDIEDLIFSVEDTGIGIPAEKLNVIFNKFSQADSSINRKYGGSGLGLSIAKSLTEAMGGRIQAESEPGQGSKFTVTLPLRRAGDAASGREALAQHDGPMRSARILLVEDSPANVMVAGYFLQEFGFEYDVAEDGRSAVDLIRNGRSYGAVLMDVQMPGMDGIEATRLIRQHEAGGHIRRTPIIAMTAHAMVADRQRCLAAGMDDYIAKPFNPQTLKDKLVDLVAG